MKRPFLLLCLTAVLLSGPGPKTARGQDAPPDRFAALRQQVAALVDDTPGKSKVSVALSDVETGAEIFAFNGDDLLNPASNAKIVTAYGALKTLGPEFRFVSSFHGKQDGGVVRGPLYFKGRADPSLVTSDLWEMATALASAGIRRVEGGIVVDDSYFDTVNEPKAFDQQPGEDAAFRAPVGAASYNYNALSVTIGPGGGPALPAKVTIDPPGYAAIENQSLTTLKGAHDPKMAISSADRKTVIRVWGQVPMGARSVSYSRRVDHPSLFTGYGVKAVLEAAGIVVGGGVQVGVMPAGTPQLAEHQSAPLSAILYETGKMSNNFVTEMILKTIGAEAAKGPATWAGSIDAVAKTLEAIGMARNSYTYQNGSGLFDANRFSARQFVRILREAYVDSGIRSEFVSQLATGGVDGTIQSRYASAATRRYVRAKTGTLDAASALSGYVLKKNGTGAIAFSILVNEAEGFVSSSRTYQEKIVTAIAKFLNP